MCVRACARVPVFFPFRLRQRSLRLLSSSSAPSHTMNADLSFRVRLGISGTVRCNTPTQSLSPSMLGLGKFTAAAIGLISVPPKPQLPTWLHPPAHFQSRARGRIHPVPTLPFASFIPASVVWFCAFCVCRLAGYLAGSTWSDSDFGFAHKKKWDLGVESCLRRTTRRLDIQSSGWKGHTRIFGNQRRADPRLSRVNCGNWD
jgi:hypothetical protein